MRKGGPPQLAFGLAEERLGELSHHRNFRAREGADPEAVIARKALGGIVDPRRQAREHA